MTEKKEKPIKIKKTRFGFRGISKLSVQNFCKTWLFAIFRTLLIIGLAYVILYPIFNMLSKAFSEDYVKSSTVVWIPKHIGLNNVKLALDYLKYGTTIWNTLSLSIIAALIQVVSSAVIGYGFARYNFKGRELLFTLVILTIIVPPQTYLIPMYIGYRYFNFFYLGTLLHAIIPSIDGYINLLSTNWTMWIPAIFGVGLRGGLFIYIFRQFFRGMPKDLEEAATIDGCGPFKTFVRIMAPNALSAGLTVFLFSLVWHWNDYFVSSMMFQKVESRPMSVMLFSQNRFTQEMASQGGSYIDMGYILNAAVMLAIAPLLVIFAFAQKYFIESVDRVGIKG